MFYTKNAFHLHHGSWSIRALLDTRLCHQKFDRNNQKPFWAYLPILAPTAPISIVLLGSGRWMGLMDLAFHRHDLASAASQCWGERAPNPRRLLSLPPSQSHLGSSQLQVIISNGSSKQVKNPWHRTEGPGILFVNLTYVRGGLSSIFWSSWGPTHKEGRSEGDHISIWVTTLWWLWQWMLSTVCSGPTMPKSASSL